VWIFRLISAWGAPFLTNCGLLKEGTASIRVPCPEDRELFGKNKPQRFLPVLQALGRSYVRDVLLFVQLIITQETFRRSCATEAMSPTPIPPSTARQAHDGADTSPFQVEQRRITANMIGSW